MQKTDVYGCMPDRHYAYDKMSVIMIMLNDELETENELLDKLRITLLSSIEKKEKIKMLSEKYGIVFGKEEEEALEKMTGFWQSVDRKAVSRTDELWAKVVTYLRKNGLLDILDKYGDHPTSDNLKEIVETFNIK